MPSTVLRKKEKIWEESSKQGGRKASDQEWFCNPHTRFCPEDNGMGGDEVTEADLFGRSPGYHVKTPPSTLIFIYK